MSMLNEKIFEKGTVVKNEIDRAYEEYLINGRSEDLCLSEDILQVEFNYGKQKKILDAGWYGDHITGCFKVLIILDYDWDTPLFAESACTFSELVDKINEAMEIVDQI